MKDSQSHSIHGRRRHSLEPAIQVICLGSGGGPNESNVTGFLVRSVSKQWSKGSVLAVDAGSHLAGIIRILEEYFPLTSQPRQASSGPNLHSAKNGSQLTSAIPPDEADDSEPQSESSYSGSEDRDAKTLDRGPFAGVEFPFECARANAAHIMRDHISTYLITHPHLDHISAFAINTAAFHNTARPKKLAALTSTVNAVKTHIFNDVIWPNLTDEDGGVGLVTFQRLADGGNVAVGEGHGQGYIEVCDGLCVRGMKISHGTCSRSSGGVPLDKGNMGLTDAPNRKESSAETTTRPVPMPQPSQPPTPKMSTDPGSRTLVVDSTAFFIQDDNSHREILFFGDVEPDSVSLYPRTAQVWADASHKFASKKLKAVFIECSYDDSQGDTVLFGHLAPRHLFRELEVLAGMVKTAKANDHRRKDNRKRKRPSVAESPEVRQHGGFQHSWQHHQQHHHYHQNQQGRGSATEDELGDKRRRASVLSLDSYGAASAASDASEPPSAKLDPNSSPVTFSHPQMDKHLEKEPPLHGLTVVVIHVKDTLKDGVLVGDIILRQLLEHEVKLKEMDGLGLGCEFLISSVGESYHF